MKSCIHSRAYPHSRGGTAVNGFLPSMSVGLSPLTRGNPCGALDNVIHYGPIPTPAGEPKSNVPIMRISRAYPHSRGGTGGISIGKRPADGLSPLTRGNQEVDRYAFAKAGPIPTHAGEPMGQCKHIGLTWAYPHSRGGTPSTVG